MNPHKSSDYVECSLLHPSGTQLCREQLTKMFGHPINNCDEFITAVMKKWELPSIEVTKEHIINNSVLMQLMFSIA